MKKYEGGSVDLIKSECGVAHVILNNPERRNAMSGSMMVDFLEVNLAKCLLDGFRHENTSGC